MKRYLPLLLSLTLLLLLSACTPAATGGTPGPDDATSSDAEPRPTDPRGQAAPLPGGPLAWQGSDLGGDPVTVGDPARYQITFNPDGSVNILADCNQVGGSYSTDGSTLDIALGPSTMVGCPDDTQDSEFLRELDAVNRYQVEGDNVLLFLADEGGTMRFAPIGGSSVSPPTEALPLEETLWTITGYSVPPGDTLAAALADTPATLTFTADGNVAGNSGCNILNGRYTSDGSSIRIQVMSVTEIACDEAHGSQEQNLLAAMTSANTLLIEGSTLKLLQDDIVLVEATGTQP